MPEIVKGKPVSDGVDVIRNLNISKNGKASPAEFGFSTDDEEADPKTLSVWHLGLATPAQSLMFLQEENRRKYPCYALLRTETIRAIRPDAPYADDLSMLDVIHDPEERQDLAGYEGHCGILGLERKPGMDKRPFKSFRSKLADLANERLCDHSTES